MSVVILFNVFILILIVSLVMWLLAYYPKHYQKKVNKAINENEVVRSIDPKTLYTGIAFIILFVLNISLLFSVSNLTTLNQNLQYRINDIDSELNTITSRLYSLNSDFDDWVESNNIVNTVDYSIISVDDINHATIEFVVELNSAPSNGLVLLLLKDSSNNVQSFELDSTTLIYIEEVTLDIDEDYEISIQVDNGISIEREEITSYNIKENIYKNFKFFFDEDFELDSNEELIGFSYNFSLINDYNMSDDLAFDTVEIKVYVDYVLEDTILFTTPQSDDENVQSYIFSINSSDYGDGFFLIEIQATDFFGNVYNFFGEGWDVEID